MKISLCTFQPNFLEFANRLDFSLCALIPGIFHSEIMQSFIFCDFFIKEEQRLKTVSHLQVHPSFSSPFAFFYIGYLFGFFRTRFQILEDTYKRRETQLKEEHEFANSQFNERIKAFENEKTEILSSNKRRIEMMEKNKDADLERIKILHKKVTM